MGGRQADQRRQKVERGRRLRERGREGGGREGERNRWTERERSSGREGEMARGREGD